jgi:hypothetical protein
MTIASWRWPSSWAMGHGSGRGCSASCNPITCLPTGLVVQSIEERSRLLSLVAVMSSLSAHRARRAVEAPSTSVISSGTESLLTLRWREMDSNPRPLAPTPGFLRLSEPRLQPICTPIVLTFAPLGNGIQQPELVLPRRGISR